MPLGRLRAALPLAVSLLVGCGATDDRLTDLRARVDSLERAIEHKDTGALMAHLHPSFGAGDTLDHDWARRTAALLFLRHRNVDLVALRKESWLDAAYADRGHTQGQVALTGAEGWLPDSASLYEVELEWLFEDGQWQLARLAWQ